MTHPGAMGVNAEADINVGGGRLALKVVVFDRQKWLPHFWRVVLGRPHLGARTLGAVNALAHETIDIRSGRPDRSTMWVDPRYFAIMGLVRGHLSMEIVTHESVHAAFCYAKRCKGNQWAEYTDFDEEEIAYPAGRIARAVNALLHDKCLYQ